MRRSSLFWRAWSIVRQGRRATIPAGWALVPVIPTLDMIRAGAETSRGGVMAMWLRMVEAAQREGGHEV